MTTYSNQRQYQREPTLGELFSDLSSKASLLVRQEVALAKAEMSQKATKAGREIAIIAIGAVLAHSAFLTLVAALVFGLAEWMSLWLAAFLVGIVLAIGGGIIAWTGYQTLKRMNPAPTQTIASLEEDKEWITAQMN
ncbi:MAG: phage holin family protein [Anaerolineales bacterium]|nr:phage holin family protein [Anaerolineales bacterium]